MKSLDSMAWVGALALFGLCAGCGDDDGVGASGGSGGSGAGSQGGGGDGGGGAAQGGDGSGAGASIPAECNDVADCQLVNDCCTCSAIPSDAEPEPCRSNCLISTCESVSYDGQALACAAGRCVAGFSCDGSLVTCDEEAPVCPPGTTPHVSQGCWGGCVAPSECGSVGSCSQCASGEICVSFALGPAEALHCVIIPKGCEGTPTCDCMGSSVCGGLLCSDGAAGIGCGG